MINERIIRECGNGRRSTTAKLVDFEENQAKLLAYFILWYWDATGKGNRPSNWYSLLLKIIYALHKS